MSKHIATGTPTQVAHPWKTVLRTFVAAAAVGVVVAWLVRTVGIDLTALSQPIIDSLTTGAWAIATGLAQWLLTRPKLQPFWAAIGLGTGVEKEPDGVPLPAVHAGSIVMNGDISPEAVAAAVTKELAAHGYPVADSHRPTEADPDRYES